MHKMHELNRPKNRSTKQQLQSKQQQQHEPKRTGLINEEQQRRIAARAAKAMEKQIRRRRDHWSLFMWGDRKKVNAYTHTHTHTHSHPSSTQNTPLCPYHSFLLICIMMCILRQSLSVFQMGLKKFLFLKP